jgi:hypothetical protein
MNVCHMVWDSLKRSVRSVGRISLMLGMVMGLMCWFFAGSMGQTLAAGENDASMTRNASDRSLQVGPYHVEVQFSADPPHVEAPLQVTVHVLQPGQFSGELIGEPGAGTDAVPTHVQLAAEQGNSSVLSGELHLSVRGVWSIVIDLKGPQGSGSATIGVTVSAPNAIPTWLGWLLGLSPLLGCAWLVYQQARYRRKLLSTVMHEEEDVSSQSTSHF